MFLVVIKLDPFEILHTILGIRIRVLCVGCVSLMDIGQSPILISVQSRYRSDEVTSMDLSDVLATDFFLMLN
jgi:hypothetical protein